MGTRTPARIRAGHAACQAGAMRADESSEVLFIGGRAGVGKSTVALEVSHLLALADVQHAVIEGDNLDHAYPAPWRQGLNLAERNLSAMWQNYREAGYRRLIYTNTVSVLETNALLAAIGGRARAVSVLLTADDETARTSLAQREIGSALDEHVERSHRAARELEAKAGPSVHRIRTDGRTATDIAEEIIGIICWAGAGSGDTQSGH